MLANTHGRQVAALDPGPNRFMLLIHADPVSELTPGHDRRGALGNRQVVDSFRFHLSPRTMFRRWPLLAYVFSTYVHLTQMYKVHTEIKSIVQSMNDRALLLLGMTKLQDLADPGTKDYVRWQNVKRQRARITTEEIEGLAQAFPSYRWWLLTGEVMPAQGQTSPEYDEANRNLTNQNAG